jgi:hypothetical protein
MVEAGDVVADNGPVARVGRSVNSKDGENLELITGDERARRLGYLDLLIRQRTNRDFQISLCNDGAIGTRVSEHVQPGPR